MDNDQITALAREYAEGKAESIRDTFGLPERAYYTHRDEDEKSFESAIRFLLRRFCLVEKSKAKQFFQSRQNILANQDKYGRYIVDEASAEKRLMLCLFPEFGKEVES